jgi:hypothetical protein
VKEKESVIDRHKRILEGRTRKVEYLQKKLDSITPNLIGYETIIKKLKKKLKVAEYYRNSKEVELQIEQHRQRFRTPPSPNPLKQELKRYNKKLEKWDEYFKKEQLKNKEDENKI